MWILCQIISMGALCGLTAMWADLENHAIEPDRLDEAFSRKLRISLYKFAFGNLPSTEGTDSRNGVRINGSVRCKYTRSCMLGESCKRLLKSLGLLKAALGAQGHLDGTSTRFFHMTQTTHALVGGFMTERVFLSCLLRCTLLCRCGVRRFSQCTVKPTGAGKESMRIAWRKYHTHTHSLTWRQQTDIRDETVLLLKVQKWFLAAGV